MHPLLAGGIAVAAALTLATPAHAEPVSGCQTDPWGFLGLTQQRTICDSVRHSDGSWDRERTIYYPERYHPFTCYEYSCSGDYTSPYSEVEHVVYPVNDGDIVAGEPGHLGG